LWITLELVMPFAFLSAFTVIPNLAAMPLSVSPLLTVYRVVLEGAGVWDCAAAEALGRGDALGAADGVGVGEASAEGEAPGLSAAAGEADTAAAWLEGIEAAGESDAWIA
jgi:hypothetical protein